MLNFDPGRYDRIAADFEKWWDHQLDRPIIQVTLSSAKKGDDFFASNYRKDILQALYDFNMSPEDAVLAIEKAYENIYFGGDGFPVFYMRPTGVLGGFMNQKFTYLPDQGTVWFHPICDELEQVQHVKLDPEAELTKRAMAITKGVQDHFEGKIALGVPDLGGVYDLLSSAYNPNELLVDLCLEEDDVKAAAWNIYEQLKDGMKLFLDAIDPKKIPGYTCWATMLSQKPYYVLQNDFSAMISSEMFDNYYLPILREECKMVPRTIYHLDGPGAVRHLDSILTIPELDGVQWINGAGSAGLDQWPDIYRKVIGAGKLCQVFISSKDELRYIDDIVNIVGTTKGLCFICTGDISEKEAFNAYLDKYGVPHQ